MSHWWFNVLMNLLTDNWHFAIGAPWANVLLTGIAAACGAAVGVEREKKGKATGTRTLSLVSIGSAVFTMLSLIVSREGGGDHAHIAAQIVSGIGFLGAGAIMHGRSSVAGLTSAATIWTMAAIGMTLGAGFAGAGVALTVLVLAVLTIIAAWESKYVGLCQFSSLEIYFDPQGGKTAIKIEEVLNEYSIPMNRRTHYPKLENGQGHLTVRYCFCHKYHREFLGQLAEMPEITSMQDAESIASGTRTREEPSWRS